MNMNIGDIITALNKFLIESKKDKEVFKVRAYSNAIKSLNELDKNKIIIASKDLADIKGIGKGIMEKIQHLIDSPEYRQQYVYDNETSKAVNELTTIHGIGNTKALALIELGIKNIHDLKMRFDKDETLLNSKQQFGLKYVTDYNKRIPRDEMTRHNNLIKRIAKQIPDIKEICIVGSYRRGADTSGDIDIIIKSDSTVIKPLVDKLREKKYLHNEEFAFGEQKFFGLAKLPDVDLYRRIDIMLTNSYEYPFALLYFTGSKEFNIKLRTAAINKGYTLNEHVLKDVKSGLPVTGLETEKDVLEFLGFKYIDPKKRCG